MAVFWIVLWDMAASVLIIAGGGGWVNQLSMPLSIAIILKLVEWLGQGCWTYGAGKISLARDIRSCPKFFLCLLLDWLPLYCQEYLYIHTYLTAQRLHMNYHRYQIILWVKLLVHKLCVVQSVNWIFITGVPAWWKLGESWHLTKHLTVFLSNRK